MGIRFAQASPIAASCPTAGGAGGAGGFTDTDDLVFEVDMTSSGGILGLAPLPVDSTELISPYVPTEEDCAEVPPDRCAVNRNVPKCPCLHLAHKRDVPRRVKDEDAILVL